MKLWPSYPSHRRKSLCPNWLHLKKWSDKLKICSKREGGDVTTPTVYSLNYFPMSRVMMEDELCRPEGMLKTRINGHVDRMTAQLSPTACKCQFPNCRKFIRFNKQCVVCRSCDPHWWFCNTCMYQQEVFPMAKYSPTTFAGGDSCFAHFIKEEVSELV